MPNGNSQVAAERAAGASAGARQQNPAKRIIFLNALPLNSLPRRHVQVDILPLNNIDELVGWVQRRLAEGWQIMHYIRHPGTIAALRAVGIQLSPEPNTGLYNYAPGDVLVIVSLRVPQRGQEQTQVNISDLDIWIVTVP